jgi:hypothetical protein
MAAEDRELRLAGYEVGRFGGVELSTARTRYVGPTTCLAVSPTGTPPERHGVQAARALCGSQVPEAG